MPGRVRCPQCGEYWPGLARFCGRCGTHLRIEHDLDPLGSEAEVRTRNRRRLTRALVVLVLLLVVVAIVTTGSDVPEAPPEDPLLDPQL